MGCATSKVSSTAEKIVTKRRKVQFATTWWKKKGKRQSQTDVKQEEISDLSSGTLSAMSCEEFPLYYRTEDSLLEVQSISSSECLPDVRLNTHSPANTPCLLREKPGTLSLNQRSSSEEDTSLDDVEDDVSLTEYMSSVDTPVPLSRARSTLPLKDQGKPSIVLHNAWSEGSVPRGFSKPNQNGLSVSEEKARAFIPAHLEVPEETGHRQRPKAAKGCRHPPDITEVYQAELSIPGTPMEDPKRKLEKQRLDAWMKRQLGHGSN